MKSFDYTADDDTPLLDSELPKVSIMDKIRSRIHIRLPTIRKKKPEPMPEPLLDETESVELKDMIGDDAELKQMIDSLTAPSTKPFTIPKIVDTITPEPPLPIPTPAPVKPWMKYVNTLVGILAFIGGAYGVMVLYNQFPTYPSIIIGIVAVSASAGVITGISTRG